MIEFLIFFSGAALGSFCFCFGSRIIRDQSPFGRSSCDLCKKKLHIKNLIPLFSFLVQGGRCSFCNTKININHFVFELISGIFMLLIYLKYQNNYVYLSLLFCIFLLLSIQSASDISEMMSYDFVSYFIGFFVIIFATFNDISFLSTVFRLSVMFSFLMFLKLIYLKIKKVDILGFGDVILITSLSPVMNLFFLSYFLFFLGFISILHSLILFRSFRSKNPFPLIPSISLAFFISILISY